MMPARARYALRRVSRLRRRRGPVRVELGLAKCRERYGAEGKRYSAMDVHKPWNAEKKADPALGWWGANSTCAGQEAFRDLDRALRDVTKSRKGELELTHAH